jgi:hypothetical protein
MEFKMKMQKMLSGLAIVASMLIAGAAMATAPTNNGANGYGYNTAGTNSTQLGSGSAVTTNLTVEDVSMIRIYGSDLTMDITPFTTASSEKSNAIALRFDSNFNELFTIALTSSGSTKLPGQWTITSSDKSDTAVGSDTTSALAVSFSTDTGVGSVDSGVATATFSYNGATGEYNGASGTDGAVATKWANAPITNIGLTVTDIDMNTAASTITNAAAIALDPGTPPTYSTPNYAGTLTFTTSTGF